jgi:hypothetical protein
MSGLTKANALPAEPIVLAIATLDSPTKYVDIANLGDISGPSRSYTVQDVSAHGQRARRKITTLLDEGSLTAPLWFIPGAGFEGTHTDPKDGLQAIFERGDLRAYALKYKDSAGTVKFFNAFLNKMSEKSPVAGVLSAEVEFTVDGTIKTGTEAGGLATAVFAPAESGPGL